MLKELKSNSKAISISADFLAYLLIFIPYGYIDHNSLTI